jgi:integrase
MAAVIKRGKLWYVKFYPVGAAVDKNGRPLAKWIKGYTDKGATRELANKIANEQTAIRNGHLDPQAEQAKAARSRLVGDHIDAYESHLNAAGRSGNHVSYTVADIRKCFDHAGVKRAADLTVEHVNDWVNSLASDSPRTINRRVGSVKAFLKHLQQHGAVTRYVLWKYAKRNVVGTERRKYRALTAAESAKLLAKSPAERRDVYRVALRTGFRLNELRSLTAASFNFESGTVTVKAADAKNKSRDQTIPLHPSLVSHVKRLAKARGAGVPLLDVPSKDDAARTIREDCTLAGVDPKDVTFHSLRHTFITRLAEANVHPKILQTLSRHSNIETTLRYYVHFLQDDERAALARVA